jgi:hypothetical protein
MFFRWIPESSEESLMLTIGGADCGAQILSLAAAQQ